MKKTIKVILLTFLIVILNQNLYSQIRLDGNFGIYGAAGYTYTVTIEIASVPFEGITQPKDGYEWPLNRVLQIQSGSYWRFYTLNSGPTIKRDITYFSKTVTLSDNGYIFDMGHCSGIEWPLGDDHEALGFAKYKMTVKNVTTGEEYKLFLNTLDSRFGRNYPDGYNADLTLTYYSTKPMQSRLVFEKIVGGNTYEIATINTWDDPVREFKVWECVPIPPLTEPMATDFYARTTPFPFSPRLIYDKHIRTLELGTNIEFGDVYNYTGEGDRFGYNTIDSASVWYAYFTYPPIFDPEHNNATGKTFVTPAYFYFDEINSLAVYGFRLNVLTGNKITLKNDRRFWISGFLDGYYIFQGDTICFYYGSILDREASAQLNACFGGKILDYGANVIWNPNSFSHIFAKAELAYLGTSHTVNNGGHIEIDDQATLKVGDNTTVTFDGAGTYLKLNPNAIVQLGTNAKIKFTNGAYLDANGATFSSLGSSAWSGIEFENAGSQTSVTNCTFNNAISPIKIINDEEHAYYDKIFTSNTFYVPSSGMNSVIYAENLLNAKFQYNQFNMASGSQSIGLYIKNYYSNDVPRILITGNTFQNSNYSIILADYTAAQLNYFVANNIFKLNSGGFNIITRMVTGEIKNNTNVSNNPNYNIHLNQSNPNIYYNSLNANYTNLFVATNSYPILLPVIYSNDEIIWLGGRNNFTINDVENSRNIYFANGYAFLDNGNNILTKNNSLSYFLEGAVDMSGDVYYVRNNCFNGRNDPVPNSKNLWHTGTNNFIIPFWQGSTYQCSSTNSGEDFIVSDKGFGIYDTVYLSSNNNLQPASDEEIYNQAYTYKFSENYFNAISSYKALINEYILSSYIYTSLYDLYECYERLDTSISQGYKIQLYSNLYDYLRDKISSENYDDNFIDIAYNFMVMCMVNMEDNSTASEAYEFIALFNPDPGIQLYASWDYEILEEIMGTGGSESEKYKDESDIKFKERRIKYFEKMIGMDPIKDKVKKAYDSKKLKRNNNFEKELRKNENNQNLIKSKINERNNKENIIRNKAASNIRNLRYLTKAEKDKKQLEDIILASQGDLNISSSNRHSNNLVPDKFELLQNYPNPFNPVTKISYDLPKSGLIKLMVYDILGREIKTLVNEFRQAGKYSVEFDASQPGLGSNLSSGVYFYKIQAGDFTAVKRMVLIK